MQAIEVEGLRKTYGDLVVVDDLSFQVAPGELLAILGHNGAGKTTTVEILEGHRRRDRGRVAVLGMDPETGGRALRRPGPAPPRPTTAWGPRDRDAGWSARG
jgi:ABC-2 type transport system ATP-binding protein